MHNKYVQFRQADNKVEDWQCTINMCNFGKQTLRLKTDNRIWKYTPILHKFIIGDSEQTFLTICAVVF
jgi:hypothetical protein